MPEYEEKTSGAPEHLPGHVEMSAGGPVCKHCGGSVDRDGFSRGGEVGEESIDSGEFGSPYSGKEAEEREPEEDSHTEQQDMTELMRSRAFADAVDGRGYARGGELKPDAVPPAPKATDPELVAKKKKHYGFLFGRKG